MPAIRVLVSVVKFTIIESFTKFLRGVRISQFATLDMTRKGSIDVGAFSRNVNIFGVCHERIEESSHLKWHHLLGLSPRADRGHRTCEVGQTQCPRRTILDRRRAEGPPETARRD